jgi:hypothetical protein
LTDNSLLLRQIHPAFHQNGEVTSQAFRPTESHQFKLSVYNGDLIEAESAWQHFTLIQKRESIGVLGVAVTECLA